MNEDRDTALLDPPATPTRTPAADTEAPEPEAPDGDAAGVATAAGAASPVLDIEPAERPDMSAVVDIIRSSAEWYEDIVEPEDLSEHYVDEAWARENFERREFFVGRLGDEIAGTISLQEVADDYLYLGYVYLHTDHVGNGFGGRLLDFARDEARRRGRASLVLIAHPEAEWACRAYRKYGFEVVAESREEVLEWADGWLEPYYEEGFQLFEYRV